MMVNLSGAMIKTVWDVLANASPEQLEVEHTQGDYAASGQDALDFFGDLLNQAETLEGDVE